MGGACSRRAQPPRGPAEQPVSLSPPPRASLRLWRAELELEAALTEYVHQIEIVSSPLLQEWLEADLDFADEVYEARRGLVRTRHSIGHTFDWAEARLHSFAAVGFVTEVDYLPPGS